MQLRFIPAALVYLGSYFPLSAILLLQDIEYSGLFLSGEDAGLLINNPAYSISFFIASLLCLILTIWILFRSLPDIKIKVHESKYIPAELTNYVLPYVVSFMSLNYSEPEKFIGFFVFFSWIFWITHKSGQIIINPALAALGWRLYEVSYSHQDNAEIYHGTTLSRISIYANRSYTKTSIQDVIIIKNSLGED